MLDPIPVGDEIADYLFAQRTVIAGNPVTDAQLRIIWENIMTIIYADLKTSLGVAAGGFVVAGVQPGTQTLPVTGVGGPAE